MKTLALAAVAVLLIITPAVAQLGGSGASTGSAGGPNPSGAGPTRREIAPEIRDLQDRPFGSMGTGTIMGAIGTFGALGTGGSIANGTGHGTGVGYDTGFAKDLTNTGYRFSPNASPTNPALPPK